MLHKHDTWLFVWSVAWIQSEHLRSEPQPDCNVLPRGDSAGGDINKRQGTQGCEREEVSVGQPAASPMVVHSILWFISVFKSLSRCALTCCWLVIISNSYSRFSSSALRCLVLGRISPLICGIMSVYHSLSWCIT